MAGKKKKDVETVIELALPIGPPTALAEVKAQGAIMPTFGVHMDADMAVSYVTSTRRAQLRKAKAEAEKRRKEIHAQMTKLHDTISKEIIPSAKGIEADWVSALNASFKTNEVELVASIRLPNSVDRLDKNCFRAEKIISNGDPAKANDVSHDRYGSVYSDRVDIKASPAMIQAFADISKCQVDIQKVSDIEMMIQKEINELQYSATDTKASLFAATMRSDPNGQAILDTLNARLADYTQIPALPEDLGVTVK